MLILLPPSEGKTPGGSGTWRVGSGRFGGGLRSARTEVVAALQVTQPTALKVRGETAKHAIAANAALANKAPVLPAATRYSGVVMQGLSFDTLSDRELDRANESIVIISGLLGLVALTDLIPDYRAAMDASLPNLGPLASFWEPRLSDVIQSASQGDVIVDLLPNVHRRAVPTHGTSWITVDLVHPTGVGGHAAKHAKGELARWLLTNDVRRISKWRGGEWRARRREP